MTYLEEFNRLKKELEELKEKIKTENVDHHEDRKEQHIKLLEILQKLLSLSNLSYEDLQGKSRGGGWEGCGCCPPYALGELLDTNSTLLEMLTYNYEWIIESRKISQEQFDKQSKEGNR